MDKPSCPSRRPPISTPESWAKSWELIRTRQPERLFLTHFGAADRVGEHLEELRERLEEWSVAVRESLKDGESDAQRATQFASRSPRS